MHIQGEDDIAKSYSTWFDERESGKKRRKGYIYHQQQHHPFPPLAHRHTHMGCKLVQSLLGIVM